MKNLILLLLFCLTVFPASAQKEANHWYFSSRNGLDFTSGRPVLDSSSMTGECSASQSDSLGKPLFYTNGMTVWNSSHTVFPNGDSLLSRANHSIMDVQIVPYPGYPGGYYIFTNVQDLNSNSRYFNGSVYYSIVDMNQNKITLKNQLLTDSTNGDLSATINCDKNGFWLVMVKKISMYSGEQIYAYHITSKGIEKESPVVSLVDNLTLSNLTYLIHGLKISPDGKKIVYGSDRQMHLDQLIHPVLLDFDNSTGIATKFIGFYTLVSHMNNFAFSPDNTKLYLCEMNSYGNSLIQYDIALHNIDSVLNSKTVISNTTINGQFQIAPDGNIYIARPNSKFLEIIEHPNLKGIACGFRSQAIPLKDTCSSSLPNFIDYFFQQRMSDTAICLGDSVTIGLPALSNESYYWTPAQGLSDRRAAQPIALPLLTTTYIRTTTSDNGCVHIDSLTVSVDLDVNAGMDTEICKGQSLLLGTSSNNISYTYDWIPPIGLNNSKIPQPIATPDTTTLYIVTITNSNGCAARDSILVVVDSRTAYAGVDTTICSGNSVFLGSLPEIGTSYSWSPTVGLSNPSIANPRAFPSVTTKYKVIVSNGDCKDSAFVTINVIPFSGAHAGSDKTVCPSGTAELGEKSTTGQQYNWQPTNNLDDPTKSNPTFTATTFGTTEYILTVTNSIGCTAKDTILVTVGNIVAKVSNDTTICSGSSVQLLASGGAKYTWSPSTGLSDTTIENPVATLTKTTTYKVKVSSGTCEDSAFVTITVNPQPTAKAGQDKTLCIGASTEIGEAAQAGFSYNWQPTNGLDDATKANPTASPTSTTQYILMVTGSDGCMASDTVLVTIGTIKAIVSNDTSICEGASAK